jgi:hypothetical protein
LNSRVWTRVIVPLTRPASEFQLTRSWILKFFGTVVQFNAAQTVKHAVLAFDFGGHKNPNGCASYQFLAIAILPKNHRF